MLNETFFSLPVEHVSLSPNAHEIPAVAITGLALLMLLLFHLWQSKNTTKKGIAEKKIGTSQGPGFNHMFSPF